MEWNGKGILKIDSKTKLKKGDLIPKDVLSKKRLDQFVKAGLIVDTSKKKEAKK